MILGERHASAQDTAFGGRATLDQVLRRLAATRGDQPALADPSDRPAFTDGTARRLTWAQLDGRIDMLARCLAGLGLARDGVVLLQLPNVVESVVALMGVMRAGLVPALAPLAWRQREISWAMGRTAASAAITVVRAGPVAHAGVVARAAGENYGLRFVCAFGRDVPDGVLALDEALKDESWPQLAPEGRDGHPGDHVAAITFDATAEGYVPVARSHDSLIVAGLSHLVETRIEASDAVATTLAPSSFAGLTTGLVTSLLSGAKLCLHQVFNAQVLSGAIVTSGATHVVLPGVVADALGAGRLPFPPLRGMTVVRRDPCETPGPALAGLTRVECLALGEIGLVWRRKDQPVGTLPSGDVPVSPAAPEGMILAALRLGADGGVEIGGACAPAGTLPGQREGDAAFASSGDGFYPSGWTGELRDGRIVLTPGRAGVALVGGLPVPVRPVLDALKTAFGAVADGVSFAADRMFGARLSGAPEDFAALLREAGFTAALSVGSGAPVADAETDGEAESNAEAAVA